GGSVGRLAVRARNAEPERVRRLSRSLRPLELVGCARESVRHRGWRRARGESVERLPTPRLLHDVLRLFTRLLFDPVFLRAPPRLGAEGVGPSRLSPRPEHAPRFSIDWTYHGGHAD